MALIVCPECGKEISDASEKCTNCGFPLKPQKKKSRVGIALLFLLALLVGTIAGYIFSTEIQNKAQKCKVDGCNNSAYSDGYCIDHYGEKRNGNTSDGEQTEINTQKDDNSEETAENGFDADEPTIIKFGRDSMQRTEKCHFSISGYSFADIVEPTNCSASIYHYFEASPGNTYIDVKFRIKSQADNALKQNEILKAVKIIYDDSYEYNCSFVTVTNDGDFENYTNLYDINPLETKEYHMLAEVPSEVKDSDGGLVCRVEDGGNYYDCVLR